MSATAAALTEATMREIEAFVHLEARLADESRYEEWEQLLTDDMHYWVPCGPADYDPATRLSYVNDNRARLATRLRQLRSGKRHAQTPASPMRRIVANLEVLDHHPDPVGEDRFVVGSNFVLYELAAQSTHQLRVWPGRTTYHLRRVDGRLRMSRKVVELVTATEPQTNLTFLL